MTALKNVIIFKLYWAIVSACNITYYSLHWTIKAGYQAKRDRPCFGPALLKDGGKRLNINGHQLTPLKTNQPRQIGGHENDEDGWI
jgi:hypothetical protein